MNTITMQIHVPQKMMQYIQTNDSGRAPVYFKQDNYCMSVNELKQCAALLSPYISNKIISVGKAAEILEINKQDLIDLYAEMGFPYFDLTMSELASDVDTILDVCGDIK